MDTRKFLTAAALVAALTIPTIVNAALIDNGTYTTDTYTGLDWLDLSETSGLSYNDARLLLPEWRYATNPEVENLFSIVFNGFYSTLNLISDPYTGLSRTEDGTYSNQLRDVRNYQALFGVTKWVSATDRVTYGLYLDEDNLLKFIGATYDPNYTLYDPLGRTVIYGTEYTENEYFGNELTDRTIGSTFAGTYLVRTSAVPIPSTIWLLGSGLIGLIGLAKRK